MAGDQSRAPPDPPAAPQSTETSFISDPTFHELGLSAKVLAAVEASGYTKPTPIQAAAIPHALNRRDVLGLAQTGTGKTASFVLPMLSLLETGRARARMPRTLILEPTRELAAQVEESFVRYGVNHRLKTVLLIGGVSDKPQMAAINRGVDVVIATPGRLMDMFERGGLLLQQIEILVVDEADRMLDMGFIPDIERICTLLPPKRQTLFFSATMPKEIVNLVDRFLTDPVRVEVSPPSSAAETVEQRFVKAGDEHADKRAVLRKILRTETELTNGIIFVNRKRDIGTLFRSLEKYGFSVGALHGDMDQRARMMTLDAFKQNKITLLVASDVAARGLDIPKVSHVFNYDVPINAEDYVHRIGRTGRAGRSGKSFTIATADDRKLVAAIEALLKRAVVWADAPADSRARPAPEPATEVAAPADGERIVAADRRSSDPASSRPADRREPRSAPRAEPSAAEAREHRPEPAPRRASADRRPEPQGRPDRTGDEPRMVFADTEFVPAFLLRHPTRRPAPEQANPEPVD